MLGFAVTRHCNRHDVAHMLSACYRPCYRRVIAQVITMLFPTLSPCYRPRYHPCYRHAIAMLSTCSQILPILVKQQLQCYRHGVANVYLHVIYSVLSPCYHHVTTSVIAMLSTVCYRHVIAMLSEAASLAPPPFYHCLITRCIKSPSLNSKYRSRNTLSSRTFVASYYLFACSGMLGCCLRPSFGPP